MSGYQQNKNKNPDLWRKHRTLKPAPDKTGRTKAAPAPGIAALISGKPPLPKSDEQYSLQTVFMTVNDPEDGKLWQNQITACWTRPHIIHAETQLKMHALTV